MIRAVIFDCFGVLTPGGWGSQPNAELFDYIATRTKPHYKLGILSNAGADRLRELFTDEQVALFDAVSLSFQIGAAKPERHAYEHIAEKLDVTPAECVFVDDSADYCEAARAAGMQAIHFQTTADFCREFEQLEASC